MQHKTPHASLSEVPINEVIGTLNMLTDAYPRLLRTLGHIRNQVGAAGTSHLHCTFNYGVLRYE